MRTRPPLHRLRIPAAVVLVAALAVAASWGIGAGADDIEDLRGDVPTGDDVREELARIAEDRTELVRELTGTERELAVAIDDRDRLGEERAILVADIEEATAVVREVAVEAFVVGGPVGDFRYLVEVDDASDLAWRQYLVRNHAGSTEAAAVVLRELLTRADEEVLDALRVAEGLSDEIDALGLELDALELTVPPLEDQLPVSDAWDRAEVAIEEGQYGIAPADKWEALRFCESTHNYRAVSDSGRYRGAYQFDLATWRTVGGTGDPIAAPPVEQDARARELYARRGHVPWPICGVHLR